MYYWIIEPNFELRAIYKMFLAAEGHEIDCFSSAKEALRSFSKEKSKPDICVIDYPLLGQSGHQLSELLHKLLEGASSKIIFSICDSQDRRELKDIDSIILEKPFKLKNLLPDSNEVIKQY